MLRVLEGGDNVLNNLGIIPPFITFVVWGQSHTINKGCCGCCSVSKSCPTLCDPKDCSTPGFPVLHHLLEFA